MEVQLITLSINIGKLQSEIKDIDSKINIIKESQSIRVNSTTSQNKILNRNEKIEKKVDRTTQAIQKQIDYWYLELEKTKNQRKKAHDDIDYKYDSYEQKIIDNINKNQEKISESEALLDSKLENPSVDEDNILSLNKLKLLKNKKENDLTELKLYMASKEDEYNKYKERCSKENSRAITLLYQEQDKKINQIKIQEAIELKEKKIQEEKEHQEKLKLNKILTPELFLSVDEKKEREKSHKLKISQFKKDNKNILDNYTIKLSDNTEEKIVQWLIKDHLDELITLSNKEDIISYLDSLNKLYKKKIVFDLETLTVSYNSKEQDVYNHLLEFDLDGYDKFFELNDVLKRKRFLKKFFEEFDHKHGFE